MSDRTKPPPDMELLVFGAAASLYSCALEDWQRDGDDAVAKAWAFVDGIRQQERERLAAWLRGLDPRDNPYLIEMSTPAGSTLRPRPSISTSSRMRF